MRTHRLNLGPLGRLKLTYRDRLEPDERRHPQLRLGAYCILWKPGAGRADAGEREHAFSRALPREFEDVQRTALEDADPARPVTGWLSGNYEVAPVMPESGRRYYAVTCLGCGLPAPVFEDVSPQGGGIVFDGIGSLRTRCPRCGKVAQDGAPRVRSTVWP